MTVQGNFGSGENVQFFDESNHSVVVDSDDTAVNEPPPEVRWRRLVSRH